MALAAYRVTRMVWIEDGPFDIFSKLRGLIYGRFGDEHWITRGLNCPFCISFWVALVVVFLPPLIYAPLGVAGGVALIFEWRLKE